MKKFLAIAFACGLFSVTSTFAQSETKATTTKAEVAKTTSNAPVDKATTTSTKEAETAKDSKKDAACHDKKAAGKSSCCMKSKTEANADVKEEEKAKQ